MPTSAPPRPPAVLSPAGFAHLASGGVWVSAPHLDLLNRKLIECMARRTTRLIVSLPPRHGKSFLISHLFPPYYLGVFPDHQFVLVSYEADFAAEWGAKAQDVLARHCPGTFGVELDPRTTAASRWNVRRVGTGITAGGMRTAGIGGPLTGRGANLLLIDDPVKNAEEANSETSRKKAWEWYVTTARTRLEPGGVVVLVMTRWHEDDLAGRLIEWAKQGKERWDVIRIPALAEEDDPLGRAPGEALWPSRYSREELEILRAQDPYSFEALYQGNPVPLKGGMFRKEWFDRNIVPGHPPGCEYCRGWDFAATEGGGDFTVGVLTARAPDGMFYVLDIVRGQWSVGDVDKTIRETAASDRARFGEVRIRGEEQPGSAGKKAASAFVLMLAGYDVGVVSASGSKADRARPFASQVEYDHVKFVDGPWLPDYISEFLRFPRGKHDDIVDSQALSFNDLALTPSSDAGSLVSEPRDSFERGL